MGENISLLSKKINELNKSNNFNKMISFKKIKKVNINDKLISEKLRFISFRDIIDFKNMEEAEFEAKYSNQYLIHRFFKKYDIMPYIISIENIHEKFYNNIIEKINIPKESLLFSYEINDESIEYLYLFMDKMILIYNGFNPFIIYSPEYINDKESPLYILLGLIKNYGPPKVIKNKIYIVYRTMDGFSKKPFDIKKRNINIHDNYNDGFEKVSEEIISKLNDKKRTGLVILHGEPGTGKTTYVRYLAGRLKKDIIFIPPDMVHHITSPEFIPFLLENSNSILIIEDAEPALQKRIDNGRTGAVSNILNMTDGLLSDCLNISIVATFNTTTKNVDEALLRHGRLFKLYRFDKLSVEKSRELAKKIGKDIDVKEPMSLAQIYFYGENINNDNFQVKQTGFGYNKNNL